MMKFALITGSHISFLGNGIVRLHYSSVSGATLDFTRFGFSQLMKLMKEKIKGGNFEKAHVIEEGNSQIFYETRENLWRFPSGNYKTRWKKAYSFVRHQRRTFPDPF